MSVTLVFDESLKNARLDARACDEPWEGYLGHALATSFVRTSQESFTQVRTADDAAASQDAAGTPSDLRIQLSFLGQSFERPTAFGQEDTYPARVRIQLMAVVADAQGTPLGKIPLTYDERVNIWTPELGSTSSTCATGQLEGAMQRAADDLAREMVVAVSHWAGGAPPPGSQPPATAAVSAPLPQRAPQTRASTIVLKATLLDENDNQILEGGEKIGVRVDATNTGPAPVPSANVTFSGTTTLIDAFASTVGASTAMGALQPGETKSTIIWGGMPDHVEAQRGELVVSVHALGAATSQTLVAAIRPGVGAGAGAKAKGDNVASPEPPQSRPMTMAPSSNGQGQHRHAVLMRLDRYRTPWPGPAAGRSSDFPHLVRVLRTEAGLSRNQMLVLTNGGATRGDLEEGLLKWLPARVTPDSVVLVYISTRAVADSASGEIFLAPFEGQPTGARRGLVSLHAVQGTLKRIRARLSLLLIDAPLNATGSARGKEDWQGVIDVSSRSTTRLVQVVSSKGSLTLDALLVRALSGDADTDRDKHISLGELLDYLKVATTIYPNLPPSAPERSIPLTG